EGPLCLHGSPRVVSSRALESVVGEPPIERRARQPERLGGVRDITTRATERALNQMALDLLEGHLFQARALAAIARAQRQIGGIDDFVLGQEYRALDDVLELANVAGPGVIEQRLHGFGRETPDLLAVARGLPAKKARGKKRNVLAALAQRGQPN